MLAEAERTYDVTAQEAADVLGVHVETVKRWARAGKVPARKTLAGRWLLAREDLVDLPVHAVVERSNGQ